MVNYNPIIVYIVNSRHYLFSLIIKFILFLMLLRVVVDPIFKVMMMCLAIPGKILEINDEKHSALVDFDGIKQDVIIALIQNNFDGSGRWKESEIVSLSQNLSKKIGIDPEKTAHSAHQIMNTHFKRNWPRIIKRTEIGLPAIEDIIL